jgi:DNA (cytosine-5)-methyltransferase 1
VKNVEIIDLFCGVGGLTCGLKRVGFNVLAGYDIDPACKFPYEYNNKSSFILQNVNKTTGKQLLDIYTDNSIKVLVGCAPCQPFSLLRKKMGDDKNENDEKFNLLLEFSRLIKECQPDVISMENVPQIQNTSVFKKFVKTLSDLNYFISYKVVFCPDYGIPQNRRRFLLLASKFGKIDFLPPTHNKRDIKISDFIMRLPKIKAGETCKIDNLHKSANLSALNLSRIKVSKPGGT